MGKLTKNDISFLKNKLNQEAERGKTSLVYERDVEVDKETHNIEYNLTCRLTDEFYEHGIYTEVLVLWGQKMVFDENGTCIEEFIFDWSDRTDIV